MSVACHLNQLLYVLFGFSINACFQHCNNIIPQVIFKTFILVIFIMQNNQDQGQAKFESFIDQMLEVFPKQKIQPLILNGFDDWTLLLEIKREDLIEFKYSEEETNQILKCIQSIEQNQPYNMNIQFRAQKEQDKESRNKQLKQEQQQLQLPLAEIPKFADNPITSALLIKGTTMKPTTKTSSNFLSTVTMINLQQKKITQICNLNELKSLQILHLSQNCITKIEGLEQCHLLKTLKLDNNYITKIEGLQTLQNLSKLILNHNMIRIVEGLENLYNLIQLNISDQQIPSGLTFRNGQTNCIGQSVEVLFCNNNKIKNIQSFENFKVLTHLEMKNNLISEVSAIADVLPHMTRIKTVQFTGCPVAKAPKYRDYLVILAKTLQQIDGKKILPAERQYLVKLYSLKHAKQQSDGKSIQIPSSKNLKVQKPEVSGNKLEGQVGVAHKLNSPTDFHNNTAYAVSKKVVSHKL